MGISLVRTVYAVMLFATLLAACHARNASADDIEKRVTILRESMDGLQALTAGNGGLLGFRDGGRGAPHNWCWLDVTGNRRNKELKATIERGTFANALTKRKQSLVYFQHDNTLRLFDADGLVIKTLRWEYGFVTSLKSNGADGPVVVHSIDGEKRLSRDGQISILDLDNLRVVSQFQGTQPTITQEGNGVFFIRMGDQGNGSRKSFLHRFAVSDSSVRLVKEFSPPFVQPTVSRDGKLIAGVSLTDGAFVQTVVVYDLQSGDTKSLTPPNARCTEPLFSPTDNDLLAYQIRQKSSEDVPTTGKIILHRIGGPLVVVENEARPFSESYCWSLDGKTFFWVIDKQNPTRSELLKSYQVQ